MTLTDAQLDEWQKTTDAATEGPWDVAAGPEDVGSYVRRRWIPEDDTRIHTKMICDRMKPKANADFIAAARTAMPLLLAEVSRLRDALELADGEINQLLIALSHAKPEEG